MRLKRKVAIVTGASKGIGRAIAIGFGREGAAVIVDYIGPDKEAEAVVQEIHAAGGRGAMVRADVADMADHEKLLAATLKEFGRVDVLVNNAGVEFHEPVLAASQETWQRTLGVNLQGPYFLSCKVAAAMAALGGGSIINISSVHDVEPLRDRAIYSISKAGMSMMTRSMSLELAPHKIRVNAISPGAILTDMNRKSLSVPEKRERLIGQIPLQRLGETEDVVGAAVFLASNESDYVTGTTIYVDGGLLL